MPVVSFGLRVPGPVRFFRICEDDARPRVFFVGVAPDVVVALGRPGAGSARGLKPGVLIGGMVYHKFDQDLQVAGMCGAQEIPEIVKSAVGTMNVEVVGYIVTVVTQGRRKKRQQPEASDAQVL